MPWKRRRIRHLPRLLHVFPALDGETKFRREASRRQGGDCHLFGGEWASPRFEINHEADTYDSICGLKVSWNNYLWMINALNCFRHAEWPLRKCWSVCLLLLEEKDGFVCYWGCGNVAHFIPFQNTQKWLLNLIRRRTNSCQISSLAT